MATSQSSIVTSLLRRICGSTDGHAGGVVGTAEACVCCHGPYVCYVSTAYLLCVCMLWIHVHWLACGIIHGPWRAPRTVG